ncbi:MAG: DNA methyltransferase, partial [Bacteroidetes bacterium]|nr:DNA methyltransferase [Bacteroidota bacterium]
DLINSFPNKGTFSAISYRPFDDRFTFYTGNTKGFHCYPRNETMQHLLKGENWGLVLGRQSTDEYWSNVQLTRSMIDNRYHFSYKGIPSQFPLYLYSAPTTQQTIQPAASRTPNLNPEIVKQIAEKLGLGFVPEKEPEGNVCFINSPEMRDDFKTTFAPIDLLDYIYAVLHSPTYREKYKEFLKTDFPRVPYPKNADTFWQLVKLGGEIRQIHLLESQTVENYITQYPIDGDNVVIKPCYETGKVYINDTQYFDSVPQTAWDFYIGGYQPAQKWLKDRKGRELEFEDILHYQKIIVALSETDRLMKEIDKIDFE